MDIKTSIITLKEQLLKSAKLYPIASAFAFMFTIACWVLIDDHHNEIMQKIAFASSFGFFLLSALYHWRKDVLTLVGGALLPLLYYFSMSPVFESDATFVGKYTVLIVTTLILLAVLPFLQKRESNLKFWAWMLTIFLALISSTLFGLILYGSLAGAIKASSVLFEFTINGNYYIYLLVSIMGIFSSHYFLSSLNLRDIDTQKAFYSRFGNFFVKYILTSIASVYALILSAYVLKILLTQEWPNGILVWLSLVFASLSLATYLFWTPFGGKYRKLLISIALVQLSLLFIAIYLRVSQYGWSTDRYMVTMLGVWFGITFIYLIISKAPKYELPFVVLALFLLISQYGWKLSAYDVSDRSQIHRLMGLLSNNPHLSNKTHKTVRCAISSSINLLAEHRNRDLLIEFMPNTIKKYEIDHSLTAKNYNEYDFAQFATRELGFNYLNEWECRQNNFYSSPPGRYFSHHWDEPISISGYDSMILDKSIIEFQKDQGDRPNIIVINANGIGAGEFDISVLAKQLTQIQENDDMDKPVSSDKNISSDKFIYSAENADIAIQIYFNHLTISNENIITNAHGIILMRKKHK